MARGDFTKAYWKYKKEGGKLSMKDYNELIKQQGKPSEEKGN